MEHARRALIIALDDVPEGYDDYETACRALKLEPNGHTYLVCVVSTAADPRTLLTVDLGLLSEISEAGTPGQGSSSGTDQPRQTASGTGAADPGSGLSLDPYRGGVRRRVLPPSGYPPVPHVEPRPFGYPPHPAPPPVYPDLPVQIARLPPQGQKPNQFRDFCRPRPAGPRGRLPSQPKARRPDEPHVLVRLDLDRATLKDAAVWNPRAGKFRAASKAEDAVIAALRETFADTSAQAAVDMLWPPRAPSPGLADFDTAIMALQAVLEPQTFLLKLINATARVAAVHAGLGVVAPLVGQFAEDLCRQYVRPRRDSIMTILTCVDIDLYAKAGELPNCATLRQLTAEEASFGIEKLFSDWFEVETPGGNPAAPMQEERMTPVTEDAVEILEIRAPRPPDPDHPGPGGLSPLSAGQTPSLPAIARAPGCLSSRLEQAQGVLDRLRPILAHAWRAALQWRSGRRTVLRHHGRLGHDHEDLFPL
jgi:hypothetical protein